MRDLPPPVRTPTVPPQVRRPHQPTRLDPRTACALLATHPTGGAEFWAAVQAVGTPLVDELPGDPGHRAVTFVHRAEPGVGDVLALLNKIADAGHRADAALELLPGSDVRALTYRLDARWRGSYTLAVVPSDGRPPPPDPLRELRRARALGAADPADHAALERFFADIGHAAPDPLARDGLPDAVSSGTGAVSVASLPLAPAQPWVDPAPVATPGRVRTGVLSDGRAVWSHVPDGTDPDLVVVLLDGNRWLAAGLPAALDAMTGLPPLVTVGVASPDMAARDRELTCNPEFVSYLEHEVLPWAAGTAALTTDPDRTIVAGQSLGGLTALYATQVAPHRFGRALAQSGSFWWPNTADGVGTEWLTAVVRRVPEPTSAVYLEVGTEEWVLLEPTRRMRDALLDRGDPLTYREFCGGHDPACWRGGLADGLLALTGDLR